MNCEHEVDRVNLERKVLQALCQRAWEESTRESARKALATYRWREPMHQAIFLALKRLGDNPELIRDHLPGQLTRMGFPDFDLQEIFLQDAPSQEESEDLIRRLTATSEES